MRKAATRLATDTLYFLLHRTAHRKFSGRDGTGGMHVVKPFPPYLDWSRLSLVKPEHMTMIVQTFQEVMV
ncbi:MAG: hypothetical protein VX822_04650 [Candidatus Neomarinimicrobiota bacterium]|nr:hypothetical protein [Candidatus Neomarinimicrobiota bacterium]